MYDDQGRPVRDNLDQMIDRQNAVFLREQAAEQQRMDAVNAVREAERAAELAAMPGVEVTLSDGSIRRFAAARHSVSAGALRITSRADHGPLADYSATGWRSAETVPAASTDTEPGSENGYRAEQESAEPAQIGVRIG